MTRVLMCGGRDYDNWSYICSTLRRVHAERQFTLLLHGRARGADSWAGYWAVHHGVPVLTFPADWDRYGRRHAGPIRNQQMLDQGKPDLCIAFPGGSGTADMVRRARAANIEVIEVPDIAPSPR